MARVRYLGGDELDPAYDDLLDSTLQSDRTLNLNRALANNPEILRGFRSFFGALWDHSGLEDRQRELVILTVASEFRSEYEFQQHANVGSNAGLTSAEIAAIARDDRSGFGEKERALMAYARAVARGRLTDPIHTAVCEFLDEETVVGVATIASSYVGVALLLDALDIDIEPGEEFVGWDPR